MEYTKDWKNQESIGIYDRMESDLYCDTILEEILIMNKKILYHKWGFSFNQYDLCKY